MEVLWNPDTNEMTQNSRIFAVRPGNVCILTAAGLEKYKHRTSAEEPVLPQSICIHRVLLKLAESAKEPKPLPCGYIYNARDLVPDIIYDSPICINGCCWQMNQCSNFAIIGIPGLYRLRLNDSTAVGNVQVYIEEYKISDVAPHVSRAFFAGE